MRQAPEQFVKSGKGSVAQLIRVVNLRQPVVCVFQSFQPAQHWEDLRQVRHPHGQHLRQLGGTQAGQSGAERIHDAVEGLEGQRLALVGSAAQDERPAKRLGAGCDLIQEAFDQRGLADARSALDQH